MTFIPLLYRSSIIHTQSGGFGEREGGPLFEPTTKTMERSGVNHLTVIIEITKLR